MQKRDAVWNEEIVQMVRSAASRVRARTGKMPTRLMLTERAAADMDALMSKYTTRELFGPGAPWEGLDRTTIGSTPTWSQRDVLAEGSGYVAAAEYQVRAKPMDRIDVEARFGVDGLCGEIARDIRGQPLTPAHAPHEIRRTNRNIVSGVSCLGPYWQDAPIRQVLDGRGRRRGARWEAFTRELANLLERCNARPDPVQIGGQDVLACIDAAVATT